ncbi:MAG: deoxycytidylate deaminase [Planctomycetota bacterium]|jgi:dCMP deaminase
MRRVSKWTDYFMRLTEGVAARSKDPSTQVGAIVVGRENDILATGYNGFAPGVSESDERWERPGKYDRVIHAEVNAIARAARRGTALADSTLYCTHAPCGHCARVIIAAGITRVFTYGAPDGWSDEHEKAAEMFMESGVEQHILMPRP